MPFVTSSLLRSLIEMARRLDADAVLPESRSPYGFEPFCAYYSARIRQPLSEFLDAGGGAAREFLSRRPGVHRLPLTAVASIGDPSRLFFSVNTPEDLERARTMISEAK
jgi:molybdopterin-guanine dinucleotide biosynthesis protein A